MSQDANPLTDAQSSDDIIVLLRSQHEEVKHLFAAIDQAEPRRPKGPVRTPQVVGRSRDGGGARAPTDEQG